MPTASDLAVDTTAQRFTGITYVIPCGAAKLDHAAAARDLYTGQMFRHTYENVAKLAAADQAAGRGGGQVRILILSALYGLVEIDQEIEPYDLKMGAAGSVTVERVREQATALGMGWGDGDAYEDGPGEVYALLPKAYLRVLDEALREIYVYVQDVYEGCAGIGEQRRVNAIIGRPDVEPVEQLGEGLRLWIGGDVPALWWGLPVLVSYGRLMRAKTLPVASAPWVLDSRGFVEIMQHGRWTITVEQYAADIIRYAQQIGMLEWVAPQDWPAGAAALERTGLTEKEHQQLTIVAYEALVKLVGPHGIHVIPVVTGTTLAGYLRHLAMWKAAGYDLTTMDTVVGIGALVKRAPAEAADIIRALHAAGVRRMHGFGVKGRVLSLAGTLLESVDSASWSDESRREAEKSGVDGLCPHNLVRYERNCRVAAQEWARRQLAYVDQASAVEGLFDLLAEYIADHEPRSAKARRSCPAQSVRSVQVAQVEQGDLLDGFFTELAAAIEEQDGQQPTALAGKPGTAGDGLDPVRRALACSTLDGTALRLPDGDLDRSVWQALHAVLRGLGVTGGGRKGKPYTPTGGQIEALRGFVAGGPPPKSERVTAGWVRTPDLLAVDVVTRFTDLGRLPVGSRLGDLPCHRLIHVLEPSAGDGSLVRALFASVPADRLDVLAVEPDQDRAAALKENVKGRGAPVSVHVRTFEDFAAWYKPTLLRRFDLVVMNPPYSVPGSRALWLEHVRLAWELLAEGGQLVAILPKPAGWLKDPNVAAVLDLVGPGAVRKELPKRSFRQYGTDIDTWVLAATKPAGTVQATRKVFEASIFRFPDAEPVDVREVDTSATAAVATPAQRYRSFGGDSPVARYVGNCIGCGEPTWDDGSNSPLGALQLRAVAPLIADEQDLDGPDVCQCWGCWNEAGRRDTAYARARTLWTERVGVT